MTNLTDADQARAVMAKWCSLAEQRLGYLTELFETGRWRRFYSEAQFLENIREAKANVEHWRLLSAAPIAQVAPVADSMVQAPPSVPALHPAAEDIRVSETPASAPVSELPVAAVEQVPVVSAGVINRAAEAVEERYPVLRNEM